MELKKRLNLGSLMRKRPTVRPAVGDGDANADTPEANAARGVRLFCESAAANSGEEVTHLPIIVDSAVASPNAAAAAAHQIRTYLSKENFTRPHVQYNAVMLIRILSDNPGPSFTKNLDKAFADTVKHLLRYGKDPSVAQIVKETLDAMEVDKAYDTNLNILFAMYRKEKGLMANAAKQFSPRKLNAPIWTGSQVMGGFSSASSGRSSSKTLPPPIELAARIEEARTSAKLLLQLVQSTPANELLNNDLVKEFAERCTAAQRSIHSYIACDNPAPDDDTMLTLIETNEQLSLAASKHQRAMLQSRRLMGASPSPPVPSGTNAPSIPPVKAASTSSLEEPRPALPPNRPQQSTQEENPFADHYTSSYTPPPTHSNPRTTNEYQGSPDSYHPGYHSTPSYLGRQESSANNLTMHGAQPPIAEEDDHRRPRTPETNKPHQQAHDVSPIAERNTVTYRY
ncbi:hypothetical protein PTNB73_05372 [Pyrenophora teres f. teres]|uniref:GAT domain-containing protein n=2 Tax=Pyrenophora teres f. teres TaxID=97479 RepID=E3RUQ9_PYRTT|nr:hypothetical protein PTT_12849 [Pyrenophora teres f. teres 0-1]KAE8833238.1 hypothetical protein HRS9139_05057 [Pyrenophora teres f. teres]CAA9960914.1 gat domain-containing protein [Pyrenophora teres f. maculata]KAE8840992.1 hypothetical protein PTNB85_04391 [Pyrenophora teres f. teres]KAE8848871.1 hypothetical protein HRS9122_02887 [Pyrenophora teres f. teres]